MENEKNKIAIFGLGGNSREVLCLIIDFFSTKGIDYKSNVCFIEFDEMRQIDTLMDIPVLQLSQFDPGEYNVVIGVADPEKRKNIVGHLPSETTYATIIHPNVVISKWVEIGAGSVICAGTTLTCNVRIGRHAQLNVHTTIGHDCNIGDFFTTGPGTNISGSCHFDDLVYFGANASIRQGLKVCKDVTVGMGAVVVKDITEPGTYIGNPVKKLG